MGLMFPRIARNFAKNGYFPTDEETLERALAALKAGDGPMCIIDTCAGEGVAIGEAAHFLGRDQVRAYAVEYDRERAVHARQFVDRCLHSDLMDTLITRQSFGLAWLNPPYGDLVRDQAAPSQSRGRPRLEKLFYQRTHPLLQYGGILVLTIPATTLDPEFVGSLVQNFSDVRIFRAVDPQFKQVVIFGKRIRQKDHSTNETRDTRTLLLQVGRGDFVPEILPATWPFEPYIIPPYRAEPEHFYRVTIEPEQLAQEIRRLKGLWPTADTHLGATQQQQRRPARALSKWHLALALAAGAISGVVRSLTRVLVVKGHTHKEKSLKTEYIEREDGSILENRILTDRFVPVIRAWDMTPGSPTLGDVLTIR